MARARPVTTARPTVLAGHAQNAVYASLALAAARARKGVIFEEVAI